MISGEFRPEGVIIRLFETDCAEDACYTGMSASYLEESPKEL